MMDEEKGRRKLLLLMVGRDWYGNIIGKSWGNGQCWFVRSLLVFGDQ